LLLFFGIIRPYKGLKYLVEAMALVRQPVHLVVAGEFWENIAAYHQLVEELGLSQTVTLLNRYIPNEEAHRLFSAADGLVAPYVGGTQSGAAGLALGYGLPMIVTDIVAAGLPTGSPKPLEPGASAGKNGYAQIVPPADSHALAQAIDALLRKLPTLTVRPFAVADDWARMVKVIEQIAQAGT
jgi:glycosyltransferase involved in cell wall biosynthesis